MDISKENKLSELIMRHLQGDNSQQELQELKQLLQDDAEAVELYVEYMIQYSALNQPGKMPSEEVSEETSSPILDTSLWMALSKYENEAPEIELPKEKPQRELIQTVVYPAREKQRITKSSIVFLVLNTAAILFFFLFLRFAPPKSGLEVATLTDSINAKWAGYTESYEKGVRMATSNEKILLQEGYAELLFDNQARVTVEGPAEFQILAEDRIGLNYGKIYSQVPKEAIGFSVYTQNSKIVDLGTEFGVEVDNKGETELHVFKGKTLLFTRETGQDNKGVDVSVGQARRINHEGQMSVISAEQEKFVRALDRRYATITDFQGLTSDNLPVGWKLVDNNGEIQGPYYTNLINTGPSGLSDTCARIELVQNDAKVTPGGWIQCLKSYDVQAGFYGSFEFSMEGAGGPDTQFLFGDLSGESRNYYLISTTGTKSRYLHEMFTVVGEKRTLFAKPTVLADIMPDAWYRFSFQFVPNQGTTGHFTYKVTDIEGEKTYLTMESKQITLPDTLMFGVGTRNDVSRFDNIRIFTLSE